MQAARLEDSEMHRFDELGGLHPHAPWVGVAGRGQRHLKGHAGASAFFDGGAKSLVWCIVGVKRLIAGGPGLIVRAGLCLQQPPAG